MRKKRDSSTSFIMNKKLGFFLGTKQGLCLITMLGMVIYLFSYISDDLLIWLPWVVNNEGREIWIDQIQNFICFLGETLMSAGIISLIMSIHTINETHQKVRDNLLLDDPSFIERYNDEEIDKVLRYAIQQKFLLHMDAKHANMSNTFIDKVPEIFSPIVQYSVNQLSERKIYCERHCRDIKVSPQNDAEYEITITLDVLLCNATKHDVRDKQPYRFIYISQEQINSFKLISLTMNDKKIDIKNTNLQKKEETQPATQGKPFKYIVTFEIPYSIRANDQCHFVLKYSYKNFTYGCLITYSLPFITREFQETYSLEGDYANDYQLHVLAYSPFSQNHCDNQDMVRKVNEKTYSINAKNWCLPGTGFVAVVRKL